MAARVGYGNGLTMLRPDQGIEILVAGPVLDIEHDAPDEVGGESAQKHHDQSGQTRQHMVVPAASEAWLIGLPAVSAKAKQALMMPEKVATSRPLVKLNSAIAFFFSASGISRSLVNPAKAAIAMPSKANKNTEQRDLAGIGGRDLPDGFRHRNLGQKVLKMGGISVPKAAQ